jgi:hypothetical protein
MARGYDHFMVHVDIGTEEKLATLTDSEFRCHFAGILPIAAKSPIRGCLIVGDVAAQPIHIAKRAGGKVTERVVKTTIHKLADVGVLIDDTDLGCWRVHNFDVHNPAPKKDTTAAERAKRYRDRQKRHATVTAPSRRDVTPNVTAVTPQKRREEEEKNSSGGMSVTRDSDPPLDLGRSSSRGRPHELRTVRPDRPG